MHVLHSTFSHFQGIFLAKCVFHQERGFFLVLFNHIISTEGPLSLKHTSIIRVVETCTNLTV